MPHETRRDQGLLGLPIRSMGREAAPRILRLLSCRPSVEVGCVESRLQRSAVAVRSEGGTGDRVYLRVLGSDRLALQLGKGEAADLLVPATRRWVLDSFHRPD